MAKWFGCFKMSPLERVKADIQEYRNIKDNLVYNETVLSSLYENLIIKYDEDYEDLLTEVDSCIKHKYVFDEKTGRLVVVSSVCKYFGNGDGFCGIGKCGCSERNYMYSVFREQQAGLQKQYDSFWKTKFNQMAK